MNDFLLGLMFLTLSAACFIITFSSQLRRHVMELRPKFMRGESEAAFRSITGVCGLLFLAIGCGMVIVHEIQRIGD